MNLTCLISFSIMAGGAGWGESFPQTNSLVTEFKIPPPEIAPAGHFGQMVAGRSNVFVASFRNASAPVTNLPMAAVFKKTAFGLEQQAILSVPAPTNFSLQNIATDGARIVLFGMEGETPSIYVFGRDGLKWVLEANLAPSETIKSLSINDGLIVCGASFKALVFEFKNNAWVESVILPPANIPSVIKNGFGAAVAVNQGSIIVTAVGDVRSEAGRAYVYVREEDSWRLQAELLPEPYIYVRFGLSVALDADTALISSYPDRSNNCIVFLFQRSAGAWTRVINLPHSEPQEFFGASLAVSGRNLVVGAPFARGGAGCAYLFRRNGPGFDQVKLYRDDTFGDPLGFGDSMGRAVAADGNSIFIGAPDHDGFGQDAGVAFLFNFEFTPMLESAWARQSDNSFHFNVADTTVGRTYFVQSAPALGAPWTLVKQFTADRATSQVEVDIPAGDVGFFRMSETATTQMR